MLYPKYNHILHVESLKCYHTGGYHPVELGDVIKNRYKIIDKLGYGSFSTVWLARDKLFQCYVAVKINISKTIDRTPDDSRFPGSNEANILRTLERSLIGQKLGPALLEGSKAIPRILGEFNIHGPNGIHSCLVMAPAQQDLWSCSICLDSKFRMKVARVLAAKLIAAVAMLHSRGIVHGDIYLKNVLTSLPKTIDKLTEEELKAKYGDPECHPIHRSDGRPLTSSVPSYAVVPMSLGLEADNFTTADAHRLLLMDYGESWAPASKTRTGLQCVGPICKRPPEAYFEPERALSYPSDIWRLGLSIWDIFSRAELFGQSYSQEEAIAQQIELFGLQSLPERWKEMWELEHPIQHRLGSRLSHAMWSTLTSMFNTTCPQVLEKPFSKLIQEPRREVTGAGIFGEEEKRAFLAMLGGMLQMDPNKRWNIQWVLRCQWMVSWAGPELLSTRPETTDST
ncbi:protein kinase [Xylaria arbuscula]|nr:protein kinase [Xylaria arbuscula]